jgi:hypothetical protein
MNDKIEQLLTAELALRNAAFKYGADRNVAHLGGLRRAACDFADTVREIEDAMEGKEP